MGERLPHVHDALAKEVAQVLAYNKAVRHLRGGAATREKYKGMREEQQEK
jgi:putative DeoR family transcriptional regulator (stage III sporulation protein D)